MRAAPLAARSSFDANAMMTRRMRLCVAIFKWIQTSNPHSFRVGRASCQVEATNPDVASDESHAASVQKSTFAGGRKKSIALSADSRTKNGQKQQSEGELIVTGNVQDEPKFKWRRKFMFSNLTIVEHPLVQHKLTIMRERETVTAVFRQLLKEISILLAYEITRELKTGTRLIKTPMMRMKAPTLSGKKLALISILRAGNGLLDGVLELIPSARVGFVGLYRNEETLEPVEYYFKVPTDLEERLVIALDPMLATGNSSVAAISRLKEAGAKDIRFLCLLAAPEGVQRMLDAHPDVQIVTAALDEKLNEIGYILPGLGDAGDRMFGTK